MSDIPGKTIKIDDEAAEAAKRAEIHEEAVARRAVEADAKAARKLQAEMDAEAARKLQAEMDGEAEALRLAGATPQMMQVECPRGGRAGEMLQVVEPFNRRTMQVKIPDGIEGGMVFDVQVPPLDAAELQAEMDGEAEALRLAGATPQMMQVECPRGGRAGEMLQVVEPFNRRTMQVKIPDGIEGGMVFHVQVPPPNAATPIVVGQAAQAQPTRFVARQEPIVGRGLGEAPSFYEEFSALVRGEPSPWDRLRFRSDRGSGGGGKKSRKLRKRATIKGGKKSRKLRKRTALKGGKRNRPDPRYSTRSRSTRRARDLERTRRRR